MIFRELTEREAESFRQYARDNDPDPGQWLIYHPVCREEWIKLGKAPVLTFICNDDCPDCGGTGFRGDDSDGVACERCSGGQ